MKTNSHSSSRLKKVLGIIVSVIAGVLFIIIVFAGSIFLIANAAFRNSAIYKMAIEELMLNQELSEIIGTSIRTRGLILGSLSSLGSSGSADINFKVSGSRGTFNVYLSGIKNDDDWQITGLYMRDGNRLITVVDASYTEENIPEQPEPVPEPTPLSAQSEPEPVSAAAIQEIDTSRISDFILMELDQEIIGIAMNQYDSSVLVLPTLDGEDHRLALNAYYGDHDYMYGMNMVSVGYYSKNVIFSEDFKFENGYWPENFLSLERSIAENRDVFTQIYFNCNRRRNEVNNIVFVDSFVFSAYEPEDKSLSRCIYITTNNYNIIIAISVQSWGSNETRTAYWQLIKDIIHEAPAYFRLRGDYYDQNKWVHELLEFNEENIQTVLNLRGIDEFSYEDGVVWNYPAQSWEKFGKDLINNVHPSQTALNWYLETEKILSGIFLE